MAAAASRTAATLITSCASDVACCVSPRNLSEPSGRQDWEMMVDDESAQRVPSEQSVPGNKVPCAVITVVVEQR